MAIKDLIPWGRDNRSSVPSTLRGGEGNPFLTLHREMNRLFDDMFSRFDVPSVSGRGAAMAWPSIEVSESENEVRIAAELPGMNEKDVELLVQDGVLTLRGEKKSETEDKDRGYSERYYGRFERRIALPSGVDEENANADFRDGVLTITMPRSPQMERGRKIPINPGTRH